MPHPLSYRPFSIAFVFLLCWTAVDSPAQTRFEGEGRVVAVDEIRGAVTLDHGPIPGLIPATRTQFPVQHVELLRKAQPGDLVRFSLVTAEESHGVLTVSSLEPQVRENPGGLSGVGLDGIPLWVLPSLWALLLTLIGGVAYALWRALREIRVGVLRAAVAQEGLRRDLRVVGDALGEITETVWKRHLESLGRLIRALHAVRSGNGGKGEITGSREFGLYVVGRGKTDLFRTLQEHLEEPGLARVIWDRRIRERRTFRQTAGPESRREERRGPPSSTWPTLGFVLVPQEKRAQDH